MQKNYLYLNRLTKIDKDKKKLHQIKVSKVKSVVDINILLNRVKLESKNQARKKIIIFSLTTLMIGLFGIFIGTIR